MSLRFPPLFPCRSLFLLGLIVLAAPAAAAPWVWDQDQDGIDDRMELVASNGVDWAFENLDPEGRLRFEVVVLDSILEYGAYVRFVSAPTPADSTSLTLLGAQVVTRFLSVPYIRVRATYPTLQLVAGDARVDRVEAMTLMYPTNWKETRALGVRGGSGAPAPSLDAVPQSPTGAGVVVAVLDTGINDQAVLVYPGHRDLIGKVLGGADYGSAGPAGYTPWTGSLNPLQTSIGVNGFHATHVAASIAGGTRARTMGGIAPGARLLDVKVLSDEGVGFGLAEGLEWCVQNVARNWGGGLAGIDVVNLSLSGIDASDGSDCVSALVDAAAAAGIIVVAAAGNDPGCGPISSPGAADGAITVGASIPGVEIDPADDALAPFSAHGPRFDDDDPGQADELKPDVVAPGSDVASAWGSLLTNGCAYGVASGTSMAAAMVSGVAALLKETNPALAPAALKTLLRDTAHHRTNGSKPCAALDPLGVDARYHTGWGFGAVDALAAWEELTRSTRTQFVRVAATWASGQVTVRWTTQREADLSGFHVQRAPDAGGAPGAFTTITASPVPALGYGNLSGGNRTDYSILDAAPAGARWWYRVSTTGGSLSDLSTPVAVWSEAPAGTAQLVFRHNLADTDLAFTLGSGDTPAAPDWSAALDLRSTVVSVDVGALDPPAALVPHTMSIPLHGGAAALLPPSTLQPWWARAIEGGDANRSGFVDQFSITAGPTTYMTDAPVPVATSEGETTYLWVPAATASHPEDPLGVPSPVLRAHPNPFRSSTRILVRAQGDETVRVRVHDALGREVKTLLDGNPGAGDLAFSWNGTDERSHAVAAGRYYVSLEAGSRRTVVSLVRLP